MEVLSKQVDPSLTFVQRENYAVITFISASGKENSTTTKAITVYEGFATSQDGWVIANASYSFGYPDGYKLDFSKFYTNGTATFSSEVISILGRKWNGNCFGLSLLAVAQYNGQIDLTPFFSSNGSEDKLNAFGYDNITQLSEGLIYTVVGNTDIIDTIENVQCSQLSVEVKAAEVFNGDSDYSELLSYLSKEDCKPIVVNVKGTYTHAMVIETVTKPIDLGNGIYKIYLYDSNSPITYADIDGLTSKYSHSQSYLTVNTLTGEWKYYYKGSLEFSNSYREVGSVSPTIRFFDVSKLSSSYFYGDYSLDTENVTNVYYSSSMDIEDMEGNSVFKVDDGKAYLYDENGYYLPYSESSSDISEEQRGYVLLPAGNYIIKSSGDTDIVRFCENQYIVAYETSGDVSVTFDDNSQLVVIENTDSENSTDFTVVIQDMSGTAIATAEGSLESNTALEMQLITNTDEAITAIASTTSDPEEISTTLTVDGNINDTNFHMNRKDITSCIIVLPHFSYTFDGTAKKPSVIVTDGTDTLVEGTDYTVSYSNNIYVGTATVTITGIGNYTGTATATFLIISANAGSDSSSGSTTVKEGLTLDSDGIYRYYQNGVFAENYAGVVEYDGGYFFVANGLLCSDAHGLNLYGDTWYFLAYGQVQTQYTGFALYDGEWFYITDGVLDINVNGLMTYDGEQFLFAEGHLLDDYSGLWLNSSTIGGDDQWYFIACGMLQNVSQVAMYDGEWFVVKDGVLDTSYNGTIEYDGATFNVKNGQLYN
ncbi:MAG: hypothetical protein LUF27_15215 [Lachnospiraceae bacterium]|nr:hypothetical protein [Lachnospiraceae bacterium]